MNNKDINNLSFTQEKLKNELDDINKNEFEKTKLGKENKQLKQNLLFIINSVFKSEFGMYSPDLSSLSLFL